MEIKKCAEERRSLLGETQEDGERRGDDNDDDGDDEEEGEALSLSDFPLIQHQSSKQNEEQPLPPQHDFDFDFDFKESEMCAADEIFFQGQILPLRRSITAPKESMNLYFSGRSSSISSHNSSTSSGGSSSATAAAPRNQFHFPPSPSPRILSSNRQLIRNNGVKKSWSWNVFRLGLIGAPPEIAVRDLKTRCSGKNSGGRSNISSSSGDKKRAKAWGIVGGCKCAVDAVDVPKMARSASDGERRMRDEENLEAMNKSLNNRTFEWLKQLSLQATAPGER